MNGQHFDLHAIAVRAMIDRGLEPSFPPDAMQQVGKMDGPARETGDSIRDLRALLWCSIDNDDSRDLDQLSVCEAVSEKVTRILVAIADVDAMVKRATPVD